MTIRYLLSSILFLTLLVSCSEKAEDPATQSNQTMMDADKVKTESSTENVVATTQPNTSESEESEEKHENKEKEKEEGKEHEQKEPIDIAKYRGCTACHGIDKKKVGPAWTDVAKRYKGNANSREMLIEKVKKGGSGNWTEVTGGAPMPPYSPRVTDREIEILVDFILAM